MIVAFLGQIEGAVRILLCFCEQIIRLVIERSAVAANGSMLTPSASLPGKQQLQFVLPPQSSKPQR